MAIKKLQLQYPLPQFDIPEKYKDNTWNIKEWDYYKNMSIKEQRVWKARSSKTKHILDFTLCKNPYIVEEYKYFMYFLIEVKKLQLTSFAEYYDRYKILSEYVNKHMIDSTSILELENIDHFEKYLSSDKGNKTVIKNGHQFVGGEIIPSQRKNRSTTFIIYSQSVIRDYYEKDFPITSKLIWHSKDFPFLSSKASDKSLDFRIITNKHTLKNVQDFCLYQLTTCNISFGATYAYLHSIKIFIKWLDKNNSIANLNMLDRDIVEKYMLYLRTSGAFSSHAININILNLKVFLEWGEFYEVSYMPHTILILNTDYAFKTQKESKYLTNEEMAGIIKTIPTMDKLYGRIIYCLIFLGLRFSEIAELSIDAIKQHDDGTYYLDISQYKTNADYEKPLYENCVTIMQREIERNKKRFGEENVKYVFVNKKNKRISVNTINKHMQRKLKENNVLGRDGKILSCTTHQFRATLATNLIATGTSPEVTSQLLGHSSISSTSSYIGVDQETVKEQLAPRLEKDEMLIRNIGKKDQLIEPSIENTIALCNGFCGKNSLTNPCAKANACYSCSLFIPSKQFLHVYDMQLTEIEASIQIAETNGYELMLKKALEDKENLLKILSKLKKEDSYV